MICPVFASSRRDGCDFVAKTALFAVFQLPSVSMAARTLPTTRVGDAARLNKALDAMEALPIVVPPARCDTKFRDGRCIVNITCRKTHVQSSMKQPYVPLNNKDKSDPNAVATYDVAG